MPKRSPTLHRAETSPAPGGPQALHVALARARQALAGDCSDPGREAFRALADAVSAFLGETAPDDEHSAARPQAGLPAIETGTSRSLPGVGQRVCAAVFRAFDGDVVTGLSIDGRPAAAIVPVDSQGNPACMRADHMRALAQAGQLPAFPARAEAATYVFSAPVSVTCTIDGDRVATGAADLAAASAAAGEHEYRHQREV